MSKKFKNFVQEQAILDNINVTLERMYGGDTLFESEKSRQMLTERTFDVMSNIDDAIEQFKMDPKVLETALELNQPIETVIHDIIEVMLFSTIARQSIVIEELSAMLAEKRS